MRVIAAGYLKESYENLRTLSSCFIEELHEIVREGVSVGGNKNTITVLPFGDMPFIRKMYGLGSCTAYYPCSRCNVIHSELLLSITTDIHEYDVEPSYWRTVSSYNASYSKRYSLGFFDDESDWRFHSQKHPPIWPLEVSLYREDELHSRLCIGGRLFENIMNDMREELKIADKAYYEHLRSLSVYRSITGLTGGEVNKILKKIDSFTSLVSQHHLHQPLTDAMTQYKLLIRNITTHNHIQTQVEWRNHVRAFGLHMATHFPTRSGASTYLHDFIVHCHWFKPKGGLLPTSTQPLEALNKEIKHTKWQNSARDSVPSYSSSSSNST